jgi:hypothetical protein
MAGGFLDVTQRDASVEGGGDERVPQGVRTDTLVDAGTAGDAHDPCGSVPVESLTSDSNKDRPFAALSDRQIDGAWVRGASGTVATLPPLRVIVRVRWPRSSPNASTLAPIASETRNPFNASRLMSAWSPALASPAATSIAPTSLRSKPVACDS